MRQSPLIPAFDKRTHASYEVRVRGTMYLWGSAGITGDTTFDKPLLLHIRNNVFGEKVLLGTKSSSGNQTIGTIQPGECFTIRIQTISGVFATCASETTVDCLIQASA